MKKAKILDLFAGVGGLSFAFHQDDNFEVVAANELLKSPAEAYALNHVNTKVFQQDIRSFSRKLVEDTLGSEAGKIDLILGGPPCQSYSTAGRRDLEDPRASLFEEYYRLLVEFQPKLFVFENVKGLLSMSNGELFPEIMRRFISAGYGVQYKILNSADYGAPQIRERVILVGTLPGVHFEYPSPTHSSDGSSGLKKWLSLRDAVSDLPEISSGEAALVYSGQPTNEFQKFMRKGAGNNLQDHDAPKHGESLMRVIKALPEGGSMKDLPENVRPSSGFGNSYGRLWWDRPVPTVTRNFGTPSSARCIHPSSDRALSTREGARLQCFPDNFSFFGSRTEKNLQIGEAVPTILSSALLIPISNSLELREKKTNKRSNKSTNAKRSVLGYQSRDQVRATAENRYQEAI